MGRVDVYALGCRQRVDPWTQAPAAEHGRAVEDEHSPPPPFLLLYVVVMCGRVGRRWCRLVDVKVLVVEVGRWLREAHWEYRLCFVLNY